jgi:hypothetical protein
MTNTQLDFRWASAAVSPSIVEGVLNAWEMERHHAAERHLYSEVMDMFEQIKADHPHVVIGAVTDGKANPLFMTFTLASILIFASTGKMTRREGRSSSRI